MERKTNTQPRTILACSCCKWKDRYRKSPLLELPGTDLAFCDEECMEVYQTHAAIKAAS